MRILVLLLLLCGCASTETPKEKKIPIRTAAAKTGDVFSYLQGFGTLFPIAEVDLLTQVEGRVVAIYCQQSQTVQKGDLLAEIDPLPYQLALQEAKAALTQKQIQAQFGEKKLQRYQSIKPDRLAAIELDNLQKEVALYEADILTQEARVKRAELDVASCSIRAPISGIMSQSDVQEEQWISAKSSFGVIRRTDTLSIRFALTEEEARKLPPEAPIEIKAAEELIQGKVGELDSKIDSKSAVIAARATLPNLKRTLWPGQFVEWRICLAKEANCLLVPIAAVQKGTSGPFVYVVGEGNTAQKRAVELGKTKEEEIVILSGITPNDQIVIRGQTRLYQDAAIEIVP